MIQQLLSLINGKITRIGVGVDDLTEYEFFASRATEQTTANNYISKTGFPWTSSAKTAGKYRIDGSAEISNTQKQKSTALRMGYQINGTGPTTYFLDQDDGVSDNGAFCVSSSFEEISLAENDTVDIIVEYGGTTGGGTMRIREVKVSISKVEEL